MISFKKLLGVLGTATVILVFSGCTSDSTSDPGSTTSDNAPQSTDYAATSCATVDDPAAAATLDSATASSIQALEALASGNFDSAGTLSATTKAEYASLLAEYPDLCGAQLGYAVAIIADLANNEEINSLYATASDNPETLLNIDPDSYGKVLLKTSVLAKSSDSALVTDRVQSIIANAILPAVDSAIVLMRNVVNDSGYTFSFEANNRTWELDKGEFAPALGVLFYVKAYLTLIVSINLDASLDNSYTWAQTLADMDDEDFADLSDDQKAALNHVTGLLNANSPFSTVYDDWKAERASIPDYLDSAITEVQAGLEFGIEESEDASNSQANDVYIVGTGEDADVSPADLQTAVDSLERIKYYVHNPMTVPLTDSISIQVNISKFFSITDGFQDFLPYYKLTDYSTWMTPPAETVSWDDTLSWDEDGSAGAYEIAHTAAELNDATVDYVWGYGDYRYVDLITADDDYTTISVDLSGCSYTLDDDNSTVYTLSTTSCVDTSGTALYQNFNVTIPDVLIFTDANGNETLHAYKLALPKDDGTDWKITDMKSIIYFPDPTFNGVFPGMTQDSVWNLIAALYRTGNSDDTEDAIDVSSPSTTNYSGQDELASDSDSY